MYDEVKNFKEKNINDYLSENLDYENPENISVSKIKNDLRQLLGEEPGVKLNYEGDEMLSETDGTKKRIVVLESITITFTYDKFVPDGNGGQISIPVPVQKEFLLQ
jgi:hypothetical protein